MGPKWPKSGVFGHFLEFESLVFSDFAYYDRQQWYLAANVGCSAEKKCFGPKLGPFRHARARKFFKKKKIANSQKYAIKKCEILTIALLYNIGGSISNYTCFQYFLTRHPCQVGKVCLICVGGGGLKVVVRFWLFAEGIDPNSRNVEVLVEKCRSHCREMSKSCRNVEKVQAWMIFKYQNLKFSQRPPTPQLFDSLATLARFGSLRSGY